MIGQRLLHYEIVEKLGEGGMGVVYKARDARLNRFVAVKVLPPEKVGDSSCKARFVQEAKAASALNHPNIVSVYDVGEGYIVTELVFGETLGASKPSLRKALDLAAQVAAGLACAHAAGIVHRDLKPANILVTHEGLVKILDFGIAKMGALAAAADDETRTVNTLPGVVLGTVNYMSPEQVRGATVDHRSDIFSFGLILYELLAGKSAFHAETSVETMSAILKQDTPELPESVPVGVRQIVEHCLEKDPANRFQSARDLSFALGALAHGATAATSAIAARTSRLRPKAALAAAVVLGIGLVAGWLLRRPAEAPSWNGVLLGGPDKSTAPRPSPHGDLVAFTAPDADDVMQLWVMWPGSGIRRMLTSRRDRGFVQTCSWSTDGSRIFYDRWYDQPSGVYSIPFLGGEEQPIFETGWSPEALPDGSLLLSKVNPEHQHQLFRYWPETGTSRGYPLLMSPGLPLIRSFPDGRRALVAGTRIEQGGDTGMRLYVIDLESGRSYSLGASFGKSFFGQVPAAVTHDGKFAVFARQGGSATRILSIPVDGSAPARTLFTLTSPLLSLATGKADDSIYLDQFERPMDLVRFSAQGGHAERVMRVPKPAGDYFAALSDGRLVWTEYGSGRSRLMIGGQDKEAVPLVDNKDEEMGGPLSAVGSGAVAFMIGTPPRQEIAIAAAATRRITSRLPFNKGIIDEIASSADGTMLYCAAAGSIWAVPTDGGEVRRLRAGNYVAVEPDDESLLIQVIEPPNTKLIRLPLHGGPEREIPLAGPLNFGLGLDSGAARKGRLVTPGSSPCWYWPPAIFDLGTGKSARIPLDYVGDFHHMSWTADGKVIASALGWNSTIWKFTPEKR